MNQFSVVTCSRCGHVAHPRTMYRRVVGWERQRSQGGTNAIALREPQDVWLCDVCLKRRQRGLEGQEALL